MIPSISTRANFAHGRHRGFRVPNNYSAVNKEDLKTLGQAHDIEVHNARLLDPAPTVDSHGFQLVEWSSQVDLLDNDAVKSTFYDECRELIKHVRGCDEVRGGMHEYRNGFGGQKGPRGAKPTPNGSGGAYGMGIHSDMCAAIERHFDRIVPDQRHFESLNIWRSTDRESPVLMMPLAVCDMQSVDPSDIVFGDGTSTANIQQYMKVVDQRLIHSPQQRWYYFPEIAAEEVLVFRQYDTRQEELNLRTVFHQAVVDPTSDLDAPMRSSIEVRMQAIYDVEEDKEARVKRFIAQVSDTYLDGRHCDWWSGPIENYVPPKSAESLE